MNIRWTALLASALAPMTLAADLEISEAWVRALPPTQSNTAAYLTVVNKGAAVAVINGASAELAGRAELHNSVMVDGYMRMEQLQGLTVAPGETVSLAPGGIHLMLLELSRMPVAGESARLCLDLASGDTACTDAAVRKSAQQGQTSNQHQHH